MQPLRSRTFRWLWIAQFVSNTGTWAQTVGAQWLMGDLGGGPLLVALVQTATSLPIFLLVLPSGALGDILDRRRLLLTAQGVMLLATGALALLTAVDAMTPGLLLALVGLVGAGQALAVPSFQAIQPELVGRALLPEAALLNGANFNVARALGPALGGALIATVGPAATFGLNAVSFVGVLAVVTLWRRPPDQRALGAEHVRSALVAGARYVASAPRFKRVLGRSALFVLPASALWALLPVLARGPLGLGSGGYGLLLTSVGVGAILGAFVLPGIRRRIGPSRLVAAATLGYTFALLVVGLSGSVAAAVPALVLAGLGWIGVLSTLNASAQQILPDWTRARSLAFYTLVFMGGQALGSVVWGIVAARFGLDAAWIVAGAMLLAGVVLGLWRLPLGGTLPDVERARVWGDLEVATDAPSDSGPVLVTGEWRVAAADREAFLAAMEPVGRARRRTGAQRWGLFQDLADPELYVETFTVATWQEYLRQHHERGTAGDLEHEERARALTIGEEGPRVRHLLHGYIRKTP